MLSRFIAGTGRGILVGLHLHRPNSEVAIHFPITDLMDEQTCYGWFVA